MRRHRFSSFLLIAAGITGLVYIMASLYLPSARRFIYGVDKSNGRIRRVQGNVTFLPWHQFYRLSFDKREGEAQTAGMVRLNSREGVPVKMTFRLRFNLASERLPDVRHLVRDGWGGWIRRRVSEAVSAVTANSPIEELASPVYDYGARRQLLRETVTRHLARSGLKVTAFEIEQLEVDREALLRYKQAELRRKARGNFSRVALFAIDGADWELITELIIDGRMPNLKALIDGGTGGVVQTIQPTVSPLVWTTVATGMPPDRHGIFEYFDRRGGGAPVTARSRLVPAVWEIAEAFNRSATVVNWWGSWPPSTEGTYFGSPIQYLGGAVNTPALQPIVRRTETPEGTLGHPQIARFLNITATEYDEAVAANRPEDPIILFRSTLAKTWSDHRAALDIYRTTKPTLFMMHYEGTDVVNHLFAPYHPPYREGISQTSFRRYWPTVANYYSEVDRLLGEWMQVLPSDTTVMVMSAHGMRWGKERPRVAPSGTSALSAHRNPGFFVAFGNNVAPFRGRRPLSVYDITPTILTLLGLPKSKEMPGQPALWAFRNIEDVRGVTVTSYQELMIRQPFATTALPDPRVYRSRLASVGHIAEPNRVLMAVLEDGTRPDPASPVPVAQWGLYAWHNNRAVELKRQGKTKEAVEALEAAIAINPRRPVPYINLALLMMEKQQYTGAEELFVKAVSLGLPNAERYFLDFAAYYRENDMPTRATNLLLKAKTMFPQSWAVAANLGSAMASTSRYTDGQLELERALALNPSSTLVLNNLGALYLKKKDFGRALDYWNRSLAVDPRQRDVRDSVAALRTHL
jgi:predicted AlkP superfamily phosphohydrolase/phosphomutase/Tfp pilus assembly protein PilF